MPDLQTVLGALMASGFAGRSARGPAFAAPALRSDAAGTPTLAPLASLARRAYSTAQRRGPPPRQQPPRARWLGLLVGRRAEPPASDASAPPVRPMSDEAAIDEARALLLIRAMIAAAHADARIGPDECEALLERLREAGAGPEEARLLAAELQRPCALEEIARQVNDPEMAEQVFLASELAIEPGSAAELTYLRHLGDRLGLRPDRIAQLRRIP
jgi:uncharacterized membrane protein YebE (DUF533 family)